LEHTGMVVLFAFVLASKCNRAQPGFCDLSVSLAKALVHDWDETITGDVARPTKYHTKELRQQLNNLEIAGVKSLAVILDLPELSQLHLTAKVDNTGLIVAIADIAAAVHRVWEETLIYNNLHLVGPAVNMFPVIRKLLDGVREPIPASVQWILKTHLHELQRVLEKVSKLGSPLKELYKNAN